MNYFLVLNPFFECFFTGKILTVRFFLTHPVLHILYYTSQNWIMFQRGYI